MFEYMLSVLKEKAEKDMELKDLCDNYHLSFLLDNKYKITQKIFNQFIVEELKLFHQKFMENNISYVFLKGYSLSADVYPSPDSRPFGDIDIMVAPKDLEKALFLCVSLGYSNEGIEVNGVEKEMKQYFERKNSHHYKAIWKQSGFMKICVELHIDCICIPMLRLSDSVKDFNQSAIHNRRRLCLGNLDLYVMDPMDIFISLSMHMLRHFTYDSLFTFDFHIKDKRYMNFKNLVDLYYLLKKYNMALEDILQYSQQYGLYMETLIMIRCLSAFFQEYTGVYACNNSQLRVDGYHNRACRFILSNDIDSLLMDCSSFANTVIKSCLNDTPSKTIICKNIRHRKELGSNDNIRINGFRYLSDANKFSYMERKPSGELDCDCMLDCHYDEKNLYFRIKTYDDELIIENGPIKAPKEHYYDTLEIHYMDPNHAHVEQYIAIHFGIQQRSPVLYLRNAYNIISSSKYEYQLHYFETGYELEIALNKELFGGNIENGLRIEFIIHDIDIKPPLFRCANRWSSSLLHGIPDPTTYAKLVMQ